MRLLQCYYFLEKFSRFGFDLVHKRDEICIVLKDYEYDPVIERVKKMD